MSGYYPGYWDEYYRDPPQTKTDQLIALMNSSEFRQMMKNAQNTFDKICFDVLKDTK